MSHEVHLTRAECIRFVTVDKIISSACVFPALPVRVAGMREKEITRLNWPE